MKYFNQCTQNQRATTQWIDFVFLSRYTKKNKRWLKLVGAAFLNFFYLFTDAPEALPSSSTYITNDNDAKSTPPMDPSVCIYFGRCPLQGSQLQQPVSAAIQYLSAVDLSGISVRSENWQSNRTFSCVPHRPSSTRWSFYIYTSLSCSGSEGQIS